MLLLTYVSPTNIILWKRILYEICGYEKERINELINIKYMNNYLKYRLKEAKICGAVLIFHSN